MLLSILTFNTIETVVTPWPRADAAGAAAYIESRRTASEPILANHWEYAYYFRNCPDFYLQAAPPETARREWVVITAWEERERDEILHAASEKAVILERREFTMTTVALIEFGDRRVAQRRWARRAISAAT